MAISFPVLASGRTSVAIDPSFERAFYKLSGFRFLGKRAVRIDILERLADIIRPLLQWKPGAAPRPEGAYDGRRFMITTAMMSILGANRDDMEEILKSLGYRADRLPAAQAAAHLSSLDADAATAAVEDAEMPCAPEKETLPASPEKDIQPPVDETGTGETPGPESQAAPDPEPAAAKTEYPETVLVWMPGGTRRQRPARQIRSREERAPRRRH